jgi:hypothetical protein
MSRLTPFAGLVWCVLLQGVAPARADLVITGHETGWSLGEVTEADTVTRFRGLRMRSDLWINGEQVSTIVDLEAGRFISLNHKARRAEIHDMRGVADAVARATGPAPGVDFRPTGREREILGQRCVEYGFVVRVERGDPTRRAPALPAAALSMRGAVWVAPESPGKDDWVRFHARAADSRLSFGHPRAAQVDPARTTGLMALYRRIAEVGLAYAMQIDLSAEAAGPNRSGASSVSKTVTAVSAAPVPEDAFVIPPGYSTRTP